MNMAKGIYGHLDLNIFFDESGKRGNDTEKPTIMGAVSIPSNIYNTEPFGELTTLIRENPGKIHWTSYNGYSKHREIIKKIMLNTMRYEKVIKINIINYDKSAIEENVNNTIITGEKNNQLSGLTIYTKFPERIIYGLLRKYGKHTFLYTDIFIEDATEYAGFNLNEKIKEQLNIQAIYRGEHFLVRNSKFVGKGEEVGIEFIDLLLGMIRNIIRNDPYDSCSNKTKRKIELIMELLNHEPFYSLLQRVKYFEWSNSNELNEVDFNQYLQVFISSNADKYLYFNKEQEV